VFRDGTRIGFPPDIDAAWEATTSNGIRVACNARTYVSMQL